MKAGRLHTHPCSATCPAAVRLCGSFRNALKFLLAVTRVNTQSPPGAAAAAAAAATPSAPRAEAAEIALYSKRSLAPVPLRSSLQRLRSVLYGK